MRCSFLYLQSFGLQDMLKESCVFAASNLRLKCSAGRQSIPECSASLEMSAFSTNGKSADQKYVLGKLKDRSKVNRTQNMTGLDKTSEPK